MSLSLGLGLVLSGRFQPSSQYYSVQFILLIAKLISVVWGCISLGKLSMIIPVVTVSHVQQAIDCVSGRNIMLVRLDIGSIHDHNIYPCIVLLLFHY